ncbi:hypothetical protein HA402_003012 [Bradysia odoriphaga]|nr:hypothetical protein HA402_003012 [Bradysia odoriphaga]
MPYKIYLRHDQSILQRKRFSSEKVTIFASSWVQSALNVLGEQLNGIKFELFENQKSSNPLESFTITKDFNNQSLTILQRIARNEDHNVSGVINTTLYPDIANRGVLYSIRDLVRQSVIVGVDQCSHYGGYGCNRNSQPKQRVYVCGLAALQFQQAYNSGFRKLSNIQVFWMIWCMKTLSEKRSGHLVRYSRHGVSMTMKATN